MGTKGHPGKVLAFHAVAVSRNKALLIAYIRLNYYEPHYALKCDAVSVIIVTNTATSQKGNLFLFTHANVSIIIIRLKRSM